MLHWVPSTVVARSTRPSGIVLLTDMRSEFKRRAALGSPRLSWHDKSVDHTLLQRSHVHALGGAQANLKCTISVH